MSRDEDKLIRQLSLLSYLLSQPRPFTAREIQDSVEGYWDMSDETFARRFHGDRADLAKVGIEIHSAPQGDVADSQVYFLPEEEYRLPTVEFTPAERRSLAVALAALDGRFAYARPLRLALTAISHGLPEPIRDELEHLPVAMAPDEDARRAGKQLARLEDAVSRGKTVCFPYPSSDGAGGGPTLGPVQSLPHPRTLVRRRPRPQERRRPDLPGDPHRGHRALSDGKGEGFRGAGRLRPGPVPGQATVADRKDRRYGHGAG